MNTEALLAELSQRFSPVSDTPSLDAQVLLAHITRRPRAWILAHPEYALTLSETGQLSRLAERLESGAPLPYVLGHWEFFGLDFEVSPAVLIPRPETELLVERALGWLKRLPPACQAADIGTGSGCIAITLAARLPGLHLLATDISPAALDVARRNAARHQVSGRIHFAQADLLASVEPAAWRFHLLCANLPYIPTQKLHALRVYGREPALALDGGADGLRLVERLLQQAPAYLAPGARLLLEIEAAQGDAAEALARSAFPQGEVSLQRDLAGQTRLVEITLP